MPQPVKIVGNPCPVCQTLYIQGPSGVYCKPCYIQWKNSKDSQQPQPVPPVQNPPASTMQPIKPNYEKEPFKTPEDRNGEITNNMCLKLAVECYYHDKIQYLDIKETAQTFIGIAKEL